MSAAGRPDALRQHWDARYATPGRTPLDEPHAGFLAWIRGHDDDRPVLVIGDGEGRNARAVPVRHPVTMVELSPVGAATCRARSRRPMEIVVADAFSWLTAQRRVWPLVAMLYCDPMSDEQLSVLVRTLRAAQDAGGGFFVEMARAALPIAQEQRLSRELGVIVTDASTGDGIERRRLVG